MDLSNFRYKKPIDGQLVDKLIFYIQHTCKKMPKIMVGIYTPNSIIAAKLYKMALNDKVIAMILDFGEDSTKSLIDWCNRLSLNSFILKRGPAYQAEAHAFGKNPNHFQHFVNYHLQIQSDKMKANLVDTIDKSERLLGTRPSGFYGHFMPFYSLYKTEAYDLASFLQVPVTKDKAYDKIDPALYLLTEKQLSPEEISQQLNIDLNWLKKIKHQIDEQLFETTVSQFII